MITPLTTKRVNNMKENKIDLYELDQLFRQKKTGREIAEHFGCSQTAVWKAKKKLKNTIVKTVALDKANEIVEGHLDMASQLQKINNSINRELERANEDVEEAKGRDRVAIQEIIVKLSAEIRKQLNAQLDIFKTWNDLKLFAEFQREVLDILDELEPGTRKRAIRRLQERRALRGLARPS